VSLLLPWLRWWYRCTKCALGRLDNLDRSCCCSGVTQPLTLPHVPPLQHYSQPPHVTLIMLLRRLLTCEICHHEPCCRSLATTDSSQSSSGSATMQRSSHSRVLTRRERCSWVQLRELSHTTEPSRVVLHTEPLAWPAHDRRSPAQI